jgi:hypothetical protein
VIRIRPLVTVLLGGALAACQAGGPSATPTATGTPNATPAITLAPTATSTPSPTIALGPAVKLTLDTSGPIVRSDDGPTGHQYVLPAAAARAADGGYVLFIVWFGPDPGDQIVTVARSDDGRSWRTGKEAILTDLGMALANPQAIPTSAVQLDDGSWQLYGWAAHATNSRAFTSWRASAPKPEGPWTLDSEEILGLGPASAWDSQTAAVAGVHRTMDGYALWYEGQGPGTSIRGDVGYATSPDGLAWTKFDDPTTSDAAFATSDPVMRHGFCGPGSENAVFQPEVQVAPTGFLAVVGAFGGTRETMDLFGATSADGTTWLCGSETPLLRAEDIPGSEGIHTIATMPLGDGRVELILESLGDSKSDLWLATVEVAG